MGSTDDLPPGWGGRWREVICGLNVVDNFLPWLGHGTAKQPDMSLRIKSQMMGPWRHDTHHDTATEWILLDECPTLHGSKIMAPASLMVRNLPKCTFEALRPKLCVYLTLRNLHPIHTLFQVSSFPGDEGDEEYAPRQTTVYHWAVFLSRLCFIFIVFLELTLNW